MASLLSALTKPSVTNAPPTEGEQTRTEIAVIVTLIFALFLGYGIRNNALNNSRTVELGEGLPSISVPAGWIRSEAEGYLFQARNPRSPSVFDTELSVSAQPLGAGANIVAARTGLGIRRSQELLRYRELSADAVTVNGEEGVLVTYAYIADPTREQGAVAPPVVVQAQDLIFAAGNRAVIVTVAADAADWDTEEQYARLIYDSLNVRENAQGAGQGTTEGNIGGNVQEGDE